MNPINKGPKIIPFHLKLMYPKMTEIPVQNGSPRCLLKQVVYVEPEVIKKIEDDTNALNKDSVSMNIN